MSARTIVETVVERCDTSPAFCRWFGNSKVVDAEGRPLKVYHGTVVWHNGTVGLGDFHTFDRTATQKALGREPGMDAVGSWFSTSPQAAEIYGVAIYPVYLRIENPAALTWKQFMAMGQQADNWKPSYRKKVDGRFYTFNRPEGRWNPEKLRAILKGRGHDGIYFPASERIDGQDHAVWVAFEPWQIKSAISNTGSWSTENPNIRESARRVL